MEQRRHTSAPSRSDTSEILHTWHTVPAATRASEEADFYVCVAVLVMESLDPYTTVPDLINAYRSPDAAMKAGGLAFCGKGTIRLEPWVATGTACALQLRKPMDGATARRAHVRSHSAPILCGQCSRCRRFVHLAKVITERLHHAASTLGFLVQLIQVLGQQITHRVGRFELQRENALR
jgi:hypothetical protein